MRWLVVALALVVLTTTSRADEISDFVDFQQTKLRSYDTAVELHKTTKRPVIVWVKYTDDQYEAWRKVKDAGIHVFVDKFQATAKGVVIGNTVNNQFIQVAVLPYSPVLATQLETFLKKTVVQPTATYNFQFCPPGRT